MSNISKAVKEKRNQNAKKTVKNFMGGTSYKLDPLEAMKMVTASSIFGEPQYYVDGKFTGAKRHTEKVHIHQAMQDYILPCMKAYEGQDTAGAMESIIDESLRFDFKATLEFAARLRHEFLVRLNPQVIMVRAAIMAKERKAFTSRYPGLFNKINQQAMSRADDAIAQFTYYLFLNDGKAASIPGILKNSWKRRVESMTPYEIEKYKNAGAGLINLVRICHAHNRHIAELMGTGHVAVPPSGRTWEAMRSAGSSWGDITTSIRIPHMALLRNIRSIFQETAPDLRAEKALLEKLEAGVKYGKQYPYRYLSAIKALKGTRIPQADMQMLLDSLENCVDIACENLPHLPGNNAFLTDNSGSAWGTCPSEYGTMKVAEIGNLSSVIGAVNSDRGTVFAFGDELIPYAVSKRNGILAQAEHINEDARYNTGSMTENGIWLFFRDAIENQVHYDNIFIYSDQQAGHGKLFGTVSGTADYQSKGYAVYKHMLDVAKLISEYRRQVNPKANVYSVQTAGYDNCLLPENGYRTSILYGWTGKELAYADTMNKFWDAYDKTAETKQNPNT